MTQDPQQNDSKGVVEAVSPLSPQYRSVTVSLLASISLVAYSNLAVTAALPDIGGDLGSVGLLPWVVTVELLASAIAVLAIGPVVDSLGVRVVYRVAMVGFVVTTTLCALAPTMVVLVGARVGQGLAIGGVIGSSLSSIGLAYEPAARPRMYAALSAVWGVLGVAGPALAAVLVAAVGWRAVFLVVVPVGIPAALIGWNRLPTRTAGAEARAEAGVGMGFDRVGLVLVGAVSVCLLFGASTPSVWALAYLGAGVVLVVGYVGHARRVDDPVVRLEHLGGRRWRNIHLTSSLTVAGGTGASAYLPLYLTGARGFSTGAAAFSVLFMVVGWSGAAWVASRLLDHHHPSLVITGGSVLLTLGSAAAAITAGIEARVGVMLVWFTVLGAGIGLVTTGGLTLLQSRARADEMGRASSAHQFLRSLGFAYGAALAGLAVFWVVGWRIGDVEAVRQLLGGPDQGVEAGAETAGAGVALSVEARAALQVGYVTALVVMALVASATVVSSWRLSREPENGGEIEDGQA